RTSLIQAAVLTFVLALNNFAVPATLQVKVFLAEVWVRFSTGLDALGSLRLSWPLVVAPLLLLLWTARHEFSWPRLQGPVAPELLRQQIGPALLWLCGSCTVLLCVLSLGVPFVELVSLKRTWTELPQALAANQTAVWNSFSLAVAAATLVIGLAIVGGTQIAGIASVVAKRLECAAFRRFRCLVLPWIRTLERSRSLDPIKSAGMRRTPNASRGSVPALPFVASLLRSLLWLTFLVPGALIGI